MVVSVTRCEPLQSLTAEVSVLCSSGASLHGGTSPGWRDGGPIPCTVAFSLKVGFDDDGPED